MHDFGRPGAAASPTNSSRNGAGTPQEPGEQAVKQVLDQAVISTVNWAEVVGRAHAAHVDTAGLLQDLGTLGLSLLPSRHSKRNWPAGLSNKRGHSDFRLATGQCIALAIDRGENGPLIIIAPGGGLRRFACIPTSPPARRV